MYPNPFGMTPPTTSFAGFHLLLRGLDNFSTYLRTRGITDVVWSVNSFLATEGSYPSLNPRFKEEIHFVLRLMAKDDDVIVVCMERLPPASSAGDVPSIKTAAEKLKDEAKAKGLVLHEGSFHTFGVPLALAEEDVWDVDEMIRLGKLSNERSPYHAPFEPPSELT
jgi:hypothetical protein